MEKCRRRADISIEYGAQQTGELFLGIRLAEQAFDYLVKPFPAARLVRLPSGAIEQAITLCGGNIHWAARQLGIRSSTIYREKEHWT